MICNLNMDLTVNNYNKDLHCFAYLETNSKGLVFLK